MAENSSSENYGLLNRDTVTATLRGGTFTGSGGTNAYGISNEVTATLKAQNVTGLGMNGSSNNYGLYNENNAVATADSSQFTGSSDGLYQNGGTVRLGVSQLDGDASRTSGTLTCFQVYDGDYADYTCP